MTQRAPHSDAIALGFSEDSVAIHARAGAGPWRCVGRARWDGDGFDAHVARLRAAALRACSQPVAEADAMPRAALWLPRDLVFSARVRVGAARGAAASARAALEERFGADVEALLWVVAPPDADGFAGVAAVDKRTVAEARAHARRLGFTPGAVTLRPFALGSGPQDALEGFSEAPVFADAGSAARAPVKSARPVSAPLAGASGRRPGLRAALGAGALALAALAVWASLGGAGRDAAVAPPRTEAQPAPAQIAAAEAERTSAPVAPVPLDAAATAPPPAGPHPAGPPPEAPRAHAAAPGAASAERAGAASDAPPVLLAALAPAPVALRPARAAAPHAETAAVAPGLPAVPLPARPPAPPPQPAALAPAAPDAQPDPASAPEPLSEIQLAQAGGPAGPQAPEAAPPPSPRAALEPPPEADAPDLAAPAPAEAAAQEMVQPSEPPSAAAQAAERNPAEATPPPPAPRPASVVERAQMQAAILAAPRPKARPAPPRIDARTVARASVSVGSQSRALGAAARQATLRDALRFDQTALIGVFGGPQGRAALVRLATGEMRRVSMGSQVDGWTVSEIGDATLGLRKGGQTRRLTLPSN